jgi:hypothetical protein
MKNQQKPNLHILPVISKLNTRDSSVINIWPAVTIFDESVQLRDPLSISMKAGFPEAHRKAHRTVCRIIGEFN